MMKKLFPFLKKYSLSLVFVIFIFFMFINYIYGIFRTAEGTYDSFFNTKAPQYMEEYIPMLREEGILVSDSDSKDSSAFKDAENALNFAKGALEPDLDHFIIKEPLLKFNAHLCKTAGMKYIPGTNYFRLEDSMLSYIHNEQTAKREIDSNFRMLQAFEDAMNKKGIPTLYVNCPNKNYILGPNAPIGLSDSNHIDLMKYTSDKLESTGIKHLDLYSQIKADGITPEELFYKTDHHWRSEFGIYAAGKITNRLNHEFGYKTDTKVYDKNNYYADTYSKAMLGSTGSNATELFSPAEDFTIYYPKGKSTYSLSIPSKNIDLKGDFDIFIDKRELNDKSEWPCNGYASFLYANSAYVSVKNYNTENNNKVLIIKDSFANAIVPYLSQTIGSIDVIDIRNSLPDYFSDSVFDLIEENDYEAVIFICSSPECFESLFIK